MEITDPDTGLLGPGEPEPIFFDAQLQRLLYECYFMRKGIVTLTLTEIRNFPQSYGMKLFTMMIELDKIDIEKQKAAANKR